MDSLSDYTDTELIDILFKRNASILDYFDESDLVGELDVRGYDPFNHVPEQDLIEYIRGLNGEFAHIEKIVDKVHELYYDATWDKVNLKEFFKSTIGKSL